MTGKEKDRESKRERERERAGEREGEGESEKGAFLSRSLREPWQRTLKLRFNMVPSSWLDGRIPRAG